MKHSTLTKGLAASAALLYGDMTTAWASDMVREADHSDLFVWIFLAFCSLIIVAQLVPAVMLFLGFTKGTGKRIPERVPARSDRTAP